MLAMAEESTQRFISGKVVADFGCGPRGSLAWAASAAIKVIPLPSDFIDVMFTMHAMRYVDNFPNTQVSLRSLPMGCRVKGGRRALGAIKFAAVIRRYPP